MTYSRLVRGSYARVLRELRRNEINESGGEIARGVEKEADKVVDGCGVTVARVCLSVCAFVVRALMPRASRLCVDVRSVTDACRSAVVKESSVEGDRRGRGGGREKGREKKRKRGIVCEVYVCVVCVCS